MIPFGVIGKLPSAKEAADQFASTICDQLDSGETLEEAVRACYRKHGVIAPLFFAQNRKSFSEKFLYNRSEATAFEFMFGEMALAIQNRGYNAVIADTPAILKPFGRLRRTMAEISMEMYEPKDKKVQIDESVVRSQMKGQRQ